MLLREGLDQTSMGALRRIASVHGLLHDDSTTRAELIERVGKRLQDPAYLEQQLGAISDDERAVLIAARSSSGEVRGLLADRDHPGAAESLVDHGLLFRIFAAAGPRRGELFAAPEEVLDLLPHPPTSTAPPPSDHPPPAADRRVSDPAFSLFCLGSALGRPGADLGHEVRAWSEEPGGWDWQPRWAFLRHLAQSAGLFVRQADGGLAPGPTLARLLDDPRGLAGRLWRSYSRDRAWSELAQAGFDKGEELAEPVQLRQAFVEVVQALPAGAWIDLEALSTWLERTRPSLVREQLTARGVVTFESAGWADLELPLLRYNLLGPFYWLGIIGTSADARQIVRRSGMTTRPPTTRREPPEPCSWTANAEPPGQSASEVSDWRLSAPSRAALGTLLEAERYLVLLERGRPSRYDLVQDHVATALASGGSIDDCRRLLTKLTQAALPLSIERRLNAWSQRFGALSVRPAVVVEARSAAELDAAVADDRVRPFIRARLGPTLAEVPAAEALAFAQALRDSGHLPRVDAALRLSADPRRAYAGLVDEQVLEFLLVSLLAFRAAWPERLDELEGAPSLLERLERQFPADRLAELRSAAQRLAGDLSSEAYRQRPSKAARKTRQVKSKPTKSESRQPRAGP